MRGARCEVQSAAAAAAVVEEATAVGAGVGSLKQQARSGQGSEVGG
jgi:hypothetical protein